MQSSIRWCSALAMAWHQGARTLGNQHLRTAVFHSKLIGSMQFWPGRANTRTFTQYVPWTPSLNAGSLHHTQFTQPTHTAATTHTLHTFSKWCIQNSCRIHTNSSTCMPRWKTIPSQTWVTWTSTLLIKLLCANSHQACPVFPDAFNRNHQSGQPCPITQFVCCPVGHYTAACNMCDLVVSFEVYILLFQFAKYVVNQTGLILNKRASWCSCFKHEKKAIRGYTGV